MIRFQDRFQPDLQSGMCFYTEPREKQPSASVKYEFNHDFHSMQTTALHLYNLKQIQLTETDEVIWFENKSLKDQLQKTGLKHKNSSQTATLVKLRFL